MSKYERTRLHLNIAKACCTSLLLVLGGCGGADRDIQDSTRAIETAHDDIQRGAAYSKRGSAYSEKARYGRAFKRISTEEYNRLFGLAIQDHNQAIALDPASAAGYLNRGQTYYDRAILETVVDGRLVVSAAAQKVWFDPAAADFKKATERDGRLDRAWDMLGLTHETTGELDEAINEYTQEMALNRLGRSRVANAYCLRGESNQQAKKFDAAIADYEKAIVLGATADDWSCDPYNPLSGLYTDGRRYDQGWEVVHQAQKSRKWIAPELLDRLKKESGRTN